MCLREKIQIILRYTRENNQVLMTEADIEELHIIIIIIINLW